MRAGVNYISVDRRIMGNSYFLSTWDFSKSRISNDNLGLTLFRRVFPL